MNEEILKILSMVKNGIMTEEDASEVLEAMYTPNEEEKEEKQTTVIRNHLPWDDDVKLRIVAFIGHNLIDENEAYRKYTFNVEIDGDIGPVERCCGNIECNAINGDAACNGNITCDGIGGSASCNGSISCDGIGGNAECNGNIS